MTRRSLFGFRTVLAAAVVVLGVASLASCQLRQFRQPYHEPAVQPSSVR